MSIERPRRYYLGKRREAIRRAQFGLAAAWRAKQEAEPGVALPATFPARSKLSDAGYVAYEDVRGACVDELEDAGLTTREAKAVIAAAAETP